jgi:hypothetical protein
VCKIEYRKDLIKVFIKIGTRREYAAVKHNLPETVREVIHKIVTALDEYGVYRNITESDGGFVMFADSQEAIAEVEKIIDINKKLPEWVEPIGGDYLNALYLRHNEFAITLIIHRNIAPQILLDELEDKQHE